MNFFQLEKQAFLQFMFKDYRVVMARLRTFKSSKLRKRIPLDKAVTVTIAV
jgi:hypothetical protein